MIFQDSDKIAPGYSDIVKNKMALSNMKKKIALGEYPTLEAFGEDIKLIVNNCRLYNSRSSIFVRVSVILCTIFVELFLVRPYYQL